MRIVINIAKSSWALMSSVFVRYGLRVVFLALFHTILISVFCKKMLKPAHLVHLYGLHHLKGYTLSFALWHNRMWTVGTARVVAYRQRRNNHRVIP